MSRVYTVVFSAVSVGTAVQDLFELSPADEKSIEILAIDLGQTSDTGDAQDEQLQLSIIRGHTSSGSGGTAPTPAPVDPGDAAASFTAEVNNTTIASGGTTVTLFTSAWNVRAGCIRSFVDGPFKATQANTTIVIRTSAPADAVTMSGTIWVRES